MVYFFVATVSFVLIFAGWHQPGKNFLETTAGGVVIFKFLKCLNILS